MVGDEEMGMNMGTSTSKYRQLQCFQDRFGLSKCFDRFVYCGLAHHTLCQDFDGWVRLGSNIVREFSDLMGC